MWFDLFAQATTPASGVNWGEKLVTFILGAVGGWISGKLAVRHQKRMAIDGLVQKIIELSMQFPHLERDSYCAAWSKELPDSDEKARYDNYCCLVFNTIEQAWQLNWPWFWSKKLRHRAVKRIFQVEELICRHSHWWEGDKDNLDGYDTGFRNYMHYVLDKCKRERKI